MQKTTAFHSKRIWINISLKLIVFPVVILLNTDIDINAQDIQYAREVIAKLGSEKMKGRGYVKHGDKYTAAYIRREATAIGLSPLLTDYYQPFQLTVNTFPADMELILDSIRLIPGIDFMVDPSSPGIKGTFTLQIIKAEDFLLYDSLILEKKTVKRFLLIDNLQSSQLDAKAKASLAEKISVLQKSTVSGIIGIIELTSEKLAWGISGNLSHKPYFKVNYELDADNIDNVYVNISNHFKKNYKSRNIAGFIRGAECPDSFLVFTAHYDHLGTMGANTFFQGAHDNASGVAMLLYLARYFKLNPPRTSIAFIFFSAEELGLIGSSYFVQHSPIALSKIKFLVNFDMVGTGSKGVKVVNGSLYKNEFQRLSAINDLHHLLPVISERQPACISDHCPFINMGVPGFYIYTEGESPDYHSIFDTLENLSLTGFEGLAGLMIGFVNNF